MDVLKKITIVLSSIICSVYTMSEVRAEGEPNPNGPVFPSALKLMGDKLLIASKGHNALEIYNLSSRQKEGEVKFENPVTGVEVVGDKVYVTSSYGKGYLSLVDINNGKIEKTIETGMGAKAPLASSDGAYIYVCNQYKGTVSKVNTASFAVESEVAVEREPMASVLSQDGKLLFVNNFLPFQRADLDYVAADVSVIDVATMTRIKDIKLDNGSNALRGIALSPDGKYVLVSHNLGRFQVPTSQLQQGWMNTSAISVVDVASQAFLGSVLLDEPEHGAAGIWGVKCDDKNIVISHSGTHDISIIDYDKFKTKFEGYGDRSELSYDLYFLYGMRERLPIVGNGPRELLLQDGKVYVPTYFSDTLNIVNLADRQIDIFAYHPNRVESDENIGEKYFNDATYCFQNWQSCNGCHPGDARTDGMNWDLMNDGIGNSKNCKSLLYSHVTPPSMISGIRPNADTAVRTGYRLIQFYNIPNEKALYVDAYLKGLKHLPSPALVDGELSDLAKKGRDVFDRLKCGECHSGVYFTDQKMHRIGEDIEFEKGWDTPTLLEVWRTGPYLFDGRAATLEEVFSVHKHGINGKLNKKDLDALVEYVRSL